MVGEVHEHRKLAAIMFTDMVGYSALAQKNESLAIEMLEEHRVVLRSLFPKYGGREIDTTGDAFFVEFSSALEAVRCAVEIQRSIYARNKTVLEEKQINIRIGVHLGDVVVRGAGILGDGVNIAARIEPLATPGGICVSEDVARQIHNKFDFQLRKLSQQTLKNIQLPMGIYAVQLPWIPEPPQSDSLPLMAGDLAIATESKRTIPLHSMFTWPFILGAVAIIAIGVWLFSHRDKVIHLAPNETRIAILPFKAVISDSATDFLGFSLADQVITKLSYVKSLIVRPSSAIREFQNVDVVPAQIARNLDVNIVLMGSYLKEGDRVRFNPQLVGVEKNRVLWSEPMEVAYTNILTVEDLVSEKIIKELQLHLGADEIQRLQRDIPSSPLAYEYYLRAVGRPRKTTSDWEIVIDLLTKSVQIDSHYVPALSSLGDAYNIYAAYAGDQGRHAGMAISYLQRALALNEDYPFALSRLALLYTDTGRVEEAAELLAHALEVSPNDLHLFWALGYTFRYAGLLEESVEAYQRSYQLDPSGEWGAYHQMAKAMIYSGNYVEALAFRQRTNAILKSKAVAPGIEALFYDGMAYYYTGDMSRAYVMFDSCEKLDSRNTWSLFGQAYESGAQRDFKRCKEVIAQLEDRNITDAEMRYRFAHLYSLVGEQRRALTNLQKSVDGGFFCYPYVVRDPLIANLRGAAEFQQILERAHQRHRAFKERFGKIKV